MFIISLYPIRITTVDEYTPHNKDICLLILILGEIVIIFTLGLTADTSFAVLPELEKAIIALIDGL